MDDFDRLFEIDIALSGQKGDRGERGYPGETPKIGAGKGAPQGNEYKLYLDTETGDVWLNS